MDIGFKLQNHIVFVLPAVTAYPDLRLLRLGDNLRLSVDAEKGPWVPGAILIRIIEHPDLIVSRVV